MNDDLLHTQLSQTRHALEAAERLRQAAEAEYRAAVSALRRIAEALLPAEWNALKREQPEAASWPPERVGDWIAETGKRRLHRLEMLGGENAATEVEALTAERDGLRAQLRQAQDALEAAEAGHRAAQEQIAVRDAELARLRGEVVALRESHAPVESPRVVGDVPAPAVRLSPLDLKRSEERALRAIGSRGCCLRADVARALDIQDSASGTAQRLFEALREMGWIEEDKPKTEGVGRPPHLLRLTARGREAYRSLFGEDPVESEYDRLLAQHKSAEHVLLNLQARDALLAAGAESVDLYPRSVPLPNGGTFDVDIVAVFGGRPLYVEAERPAVDRGRARKWENYAAVTREFYVVVPNEKAKQVVITEINTWAHRNEHAQGVTLHVCQLSGFDGKTLWQYERQLGQREY